MYVVGDYILVEPFDVEDSIVELLEKEQERRISSVGEVISVGKDAKAKGVRIGAIAMMSKSSHNIYFVKIAGKTYARCEIKDIAIFYADMAEYEAVVLCEEKLEENKKRVASIITPQRMRLKLN